VEFIEGNTLGPSFCSDRTLYIATTLQHTLKAYLLSENINGLTAGERDVRSWTKLTLTGFILLSYSRLHNVRNLERFFCKKKSTGFYH
jgi:hypothetical protein